MIYKQTQTAAAKLGQLQKIAVREFSSLLKRMSEATEDDNSSFKTVFSGKSKEQIISMITVASESGGDAWRKQGDTLVRLLTDLLVYYRDEGEVILTPSLYLQYLDLNNLQELIALKTSSKRHEALLLPIREFYYSVMANHESESRKNEHFGSIVLPIINNLTYLESIKMPDSLADRHSIQKSRNLRIAYADYSYLHVSDDHLSDLAENGIWLVRKHFKQSTFQGMVGSLNAQYTVFDDCILDKGKFYYSLFEWTKFIDTSIKDTTFNECHFHEVDFEGMTNSESAVFIHCSFQSCKMSNSKALFIDCGFGDCDKDTLRVINNPKNTPQKSQYDSTKYEVSEAYLTDMRNLFVSGRSEILIGSISGMVEDNNDGDEVGNDRVLAFITAITKPLVYLRDKGHIQLSPAIYSKYMDLSKAEQLAFKHDGKYGAEFNDVIRPLAAYIESVPGYNRSRINEGQSKQTNEQFGFIAIQIIKTLNHLQSPKQQTAEQEGFTALKAQE